VVLVCLSSAYPFRLIRKRKQSTCFLRQLQQCRGFPSDSSQKKTPARLLLAMTAYAGGSNPVGDGCDQEFRLAFVRGLFFDYFYTVDFKQ
jgi:hypothetical protein